MNKRILLVEDEDGLRTSLSYRLRVQGYVVDTAVDGIEAFEQATNLPLDLIVLDLMLPCRSGLDVCRDLRQAGITTPILILTARRSVVDKVVGLKLGADDYLTKPFEADELLARVEGLLRREVTHETQGVHNFGSLCIDVRRAEVTRDGTPIHLTAREFQLLCYLVERSGTLVSRDELLSSVWNYDPDSSTRTIDAHVANLREKMEENPEHPKLILTVRRLGYKFMRPGHN